MDWRVTPIPRKAASRCPATAFNTPATVGLPPDFDRFPLTVGPGAPAPPSRASNARYIARILRGSRALRAGAPLTLKRSKSAATLTRCRIQSSRRSYAAPLGRSAVPTVAGEDRPRRGSRTKVGWRSHGALVAPYEGVFRADGKTPSRLCQLHTACGASDSNSGSLSGSIASSLALQVGRCAPDLSLRLHNRLA